MNLKKGGRELSRPFTQLRGIVGTGHPLPKRITPIDKLDLVAEAEEVGSVPKPETPARTRRKPTAVGKVIHAESWFTRPTRCKPIRGRITTRLMDQAYREHGLALRLIDHAISLECRRSV